jgi:hypothetical protein
VRILTSLHLSSRPVLRSSGFDSATRDTQKSTVKNPTMLLSCLLFVWFFPLHLTGFPVSAHTADAKPGWQAEWERTIRAAEKEGAVAVAIFDQGPVTEGVVDAFQKAFPKIKVNSLRARGSQLGPKIISERRAEKYLIDLFTGGKTTALSTLHAGKALDPIKPLLLLPEVIDPSKWWQGRLRYVDAEEAYVLAFLGNGGGVDVTFNTNLVNPKELKSYWDLVNPKWKGKIVATDPRVPGQERGCCISTTARPWDRISCASSMAKWTSQSAGITASRWIGCRSVSTCCVSPAIRGKWKRR